MKKLMTIAAASIAVGFTGASNAAEVDFSDFADGNTGGVTNGSVLTINGVEMTFNATSGGGATPYFDGPFRGDPGGLGVCRVYSEGAPGVNETEGKCTSNPNDDDDDSIDGRTGDGEAVMIDFTEAYNLLDISFRGTLHEPQSSIGSGKLLFNAVFDGGAVFGLTELTFDELTALAQSGALKNVVRVWFKYVDTEFYIDKISDVPIPGALPLLISGLAGLGFASRRRKAAAA